MGLSTVYGVLKVAYTYDAWGNVLSVTGSMADTLGYWNPCRYRGYVYDNETQLYYLQSRYYNPEVGRFINADALVATGQGLLGNNMFAYCNNNPIIYMDSTGNRPISRDMCAYMFDGGGHVPKMITSQYDEDVGNKRLGIATVSHGGCGAVATYNALITLGTAKSFDEVLSYYNGSYDRTVAGGLLGILPHQVANYFRDNGYRVIMTNNADGIEIFSRTADACILWYAYPKEPLFNAHFVHYHKYGKQYKAYNTNRKGGISIFEHPYDYGDDGNRYCPIGIFIYQ